MLSENKGAAETRVLFQALVVKYPSRAALAEKCCYSLSYLSYLSCGRRTASAGFCEWVKSTHPDLRHLCLAVQLRKVMD